MIADPLLNTLGDVQALSPIDSLAEMLKVVEEGKRKDTLGNLHANALVDTLAEQLRKRRAKPFATN